MGNQLQNWKIKRKVCPEGGGSADTTAIGGRSRREGEERWRRYRGKGKFKKYFLEKIGWWAMVRCRGVVLMRRGLLKKTSGGVE